jgi:hypothetical protein
MERAVGRGGAGGDRAVEAEVLWRLLVAVMDTAVEGVVGEDGTVFWCVADPLRATVEVRALLELLRQGYEYLRGRMDDTARTERQVA